MTALAEAEIWLQALPKVLSDFRIRPEGIIHLGAHDGREVPHYQALGFDPITLVEPLPARAAALRAAYPGIGVFEAAVGSDPGWRLLHVTTPDEASSLLPPRDLDVLESVLVRVWRLDQILSWQTTVLVADIQGAEIDALSSGSLGSLRLCVVETTSEARYEGGADAEAVHAFFEERGWAPYVGFPHRLNREIVDWVYLPQ